MPNTLLEISEEITPERMKGWSQSKNNTQLWMGLVIEARSDAVKRNIAEEPEIKLPTSAGSSKKQESSRKISISVFFFFSN